MGKRIGRASKKALAAAMLAGAASAALALSGNQQVDLAAAGRYEDLRIGLEQDAARAPLKTPDLHALCYAYAKTKRYAKLFDCADRLAQAIAGGDTATRLFGLDDASAVPHLLRAEALLDLADYAGATAEAKKALAWYKAEASDDTDILLDSLSLLSMASTLAGKREDGERFAAELQDVGTFTLAGSGYVSAKAIALARAQMALGNHQKVLDAIAADRLFSLHAFLDKLVSGAVLTGSNNWAWQELPRAFMVNRALRGLGRDAEAKAGYDSLLAQPQIADNGEIHWLTLYERGLIAEGENQRDAAIELYRRAIEVIERQRSSIHTEASKIGFVGDKQHVYQRMVAALYAAGRQSEAFDYVERSKARALVDMLASRGASLAGADQGAARLLREADEAEAEASAQLPGASGRTAARSLAAQAVERVKAASPELGSLISVSAASSAELRAALPESEALLQYYHQDKTLYAMVLTRRELQMVALDGAGLEQDIRKFRAAMQEADDAALPLSAKLYDRLLRPLEAHIGASRSLLIVPHGALHYLPFAALSDGKRYLLEKQALHVLPSASVMKYLHASQSGKGAQMLVLGNPDLGNAKYDLPSAQAEAQQIARQWSGARLLLRAEASETGFRNAAARYPLLHVAAHGVFNQKKPLDSALMLSADQANDGKLTVAELYGLRFNADLVTLSACETGLGQVNSGDDVVGLTRGFLYAGASSVVASLWQVDDDATAELMTRFYAEYAQRNKMEALRAAQLEVRKKYPHPYYWSAFYLTGSAE
jgi:CHAT domain-containing protein